MPSRLATKKWEIKAEENLMYVAITRAKSTLNYIKEEVKGFYKNFTTSNNMEEDIEKIRTRMNYVSNIRTTEIKHQYPLTTEECSRPEILKNGGAKKKKGALKFCELD